VLLMIYPCGNLVGVLVLLLLLSIIRVPGASQVQCQACTTHLGADIAGYSEEALQHQAGGGDLRANST
jgi:hypothetical protein